MKRRCGKLALLPVLLMVPLGAWGACPNPSGTALSFGSYTGTQPTPTNTVTTKCPSGGGMGVTSYNVGLTAGTGTGATTTVRVMKGPGGATLKL